MTLIASQHRVQIKPEASFAASDTDFSSGATQLEIVDPGLTVGPAKELATLNSNFGFPVQRRVAVARNNAGALNTLIHKSDHDLLAKLMFGGLATNLPSRSTTYAFRRSKGSVSGQRVRGAAANSVNISATAGGVVGLSYDIVGAIEEKIDAPSISLPTNFETPYRFATALAVLNGAAPVSVKEIGLTINNNLVRGPHRTSSLNISYLEYGELDITGRARFLWNSETYNDLVRGTATGYIYLLFGDAMATATGSNTWNTADFFTAADKAIKWDGSALSNETVAITAGALTNTGSTGDMLVQNPILIKLNAVEIPDAPESVGEGRLIEQTLNFQISAPGASATKPVQIYIDELP